MWVNKELYQVVLDDNKKLMHEWNVAHGANELLIGQHMELRSQKVKDDVSIDWLRHRVNALEKQNAVLVMKVGGVAFPVPEIVPTRPGTISTPDFDSMPSFEDVGDKEAARLHLTHDDNGVLSFKDK